jgi:hypothetical protein
MPLFHPAAALYNGGLRQTLIDDFSNIPKVLKTIEKESKNTNNNNAKEKTNAK